MYSAGKNPRDLCILERPVKCSVATSGLRLKACCWGREPTSTAGKSLNVRFRVLGFGFRV